MWLTQRIKAMRTHVDRYPEAVHIIRDIWNEYVTDLWRTFGPENSMIKAAELTGFTPKANMEFSTSEGFAFAPVSADIQKVTMLIKRQTLWKASQHKRSDLAELSGTTLDHRITKHLDCMDPLRRAAVDQTLCGTVTAQAQLAKQHKVSPARTHCGRRPKASSSPPETLEQRYCEYPKWTPFNRTTQSYPHLPLRWQL